MAALHSKGVASIDRIKREVVTKSGVVVPYDKLVITSGPWTNKMLAGGGKTGNHFPTENLLKDTGGLL